MPANSQNLPASLADVALIDAPAAASAGGISVSTWHDLVSKGKAPKPLRFGARCTRWKASEVRDWIIKRCEEAEADNTATAVVMARAKKASAAARAKRATGMVAA